MRWLIILLAMILLGLQYRLWFGEGSYAQRAELRRAVEQQQSRNSRLQERNRILSEEVDALKNGLDAMEERARMDLGMIHEGETFYLVVDQPVKRAKQPSHIQVSLPEDAAEGLPEIPAGQNNNDTGVTQ